MVFSTEMRDYRAIMQIESFLRFNGSTRKKIFQFRFPGLCTGRLPPEYLNDALCLGRF